MQYNSKEGWFWLDPVASIFIGLIIAFAAWRIVSEGLSIFLEAAPRHLDMEELVAGMRQVPGIKEVP